jgi:CubicO group peptidase (beta-lactamase class C family)
LAAARYWLICASASRIGARHRDQALERRIHFVDHEDAGREHRGAEKQKGIIMCNSKILIAVPLLLMLLLVGSSGAVLADDAGRRHCSAHPIPHSVLDRLIGQMVETLISSVNPPAGLHIGFTIGVVQPACNPDGYIAENFFYGDLISENTPACTGNGPAPVALPLDEKTEFHIGSTSKTFSGNLLAQMTINNQALLDDTVNQYIPDAPTFNGNPIRVRDLADYTSGLPTTPSPVDFSRTMACWNGIFPAQCWPADTSIDQFAVQTLMFSPGTQYFYSNWALGILSIIEAQIAGGMALQNSMTYDTYVQEWKTLIDQKVTNPIGMYHSHVFTPFIDDPLLPTAYSDPANGTINCRFQPEYPADLATGGIILTPGDFLTYLLYMMGLIETPISNVVPYELSPLTSVKTGGSAALDMTWFNPQLKRTGLTYYYKNGSGDGFESFIAFIPSTKTGVAALINANGLSPASVGFPVLQILNGLSPDNSEQNMDDPG